MTKTHTSVSPAELLPEGVEGQCIGQPDVILDQHPPVGSVHRGGLDFGALAVPVCPVEVTGGLRTAATDYTATGPGESQRLECNRWLFLTLHQSLQLLNSDTVKHAMT